MVEFFLMNLTKLSRALMSKNQTRAQLTLDFEHAFKSAGHFLTATVCQI